MGWKETDSDFSEENAGGAEYIFGRFHARGVPRERYGNNRGIQ